METVVHLGAAHTAASAEMLAIARAGPWIDDVLVWSPPTTRAGLLAGLLGDPSGSDGGVLDRARGRIAIRAAEADRDGASAILLVEPRLLGTPRESLALARLYPTARARLVRASHALPPIRRAILTIRSPAAWWGSALASAVARGAPLPDKATRSAIARGRRGWRDVVEDLTKALPDAERIVQVPDGDAADHAAAIFFTPTQRAAMAARHRADLDWLAAGAGGAARLWTLPAGAPTPHPIRDGGRDGRRHQT